MAFCLIKQQVDKLRSAFANNEIDPEYLSKLSSENRRNFLAKYVGEENAVETNALFESKLLLKNQKAGFLAWAKKIAGVTPQVRRDLLSRIEKLETVLNPKEEQAFLQDLANTRLGIEVTQEEAKTISDYSNKIIEAKKGFDSKTNKWTDENAKLEYGLNKVAIENYVNNLKLESSETKFLKQPVKKVVELIGEAPGMLKSIQASLDNSFFGRQGIKTLLDPTTSNIWFRNFIKSWRDIAVELKGVDAVDAIKADIYSRPNAVNGKYDAGNYGLNVLSEEAYPSSLPGKIPLLGRLFKASESAYNGAALRMRADLADKLIAMAERNGINTLSKEESKPIGNLVGSLTGRGNIGGFEKVGKELNVLFYSVKFLKANIDTLLAPAKYVSTKIGEKVGLEGYETKGQEFAAKEAAKSTLRIVSTVAVVLALAKLIDPDSVDEDPRSTNFGKIKIFGHWVDITGGMGSLVRLAMRIVPTWHNGVLSNWSKNSAGEYRDLREQGFGKRTVLDEIEDFAEGKFSPFAGVSRDSFKGELFGGEPFTWEGAAKNVLTPLPVQTAEKLLKDPKSEFILGSLILEGLGFSTGSSQAPKTDWEQSTSKEILQFRKKVGEDKFKKANDDYNRVYQWWYNDISQKDAYKKLSDDAKTNLKTKAKDKVKEMVFKANNFKYKETKKTYKEKSDAKQLEKLLP